MAVPQLNDERCEVWTARYDGTTNGHDVPSILVHNFALAPEGDRAFLTGLSQGPGATSSDLAWDYATVAWDTSTGQQVWAARHEGGGNDLAMALDVSPDGELVFVTGQSDDRFHTLAYSADDGQVAWEAISAEMGTPYAITASSDGTSVYVTGASSGDVMTVAYDATTGELSWKARFDDRGGSDGGFVVVAGPACRTSDGVLSECVYVGGWGQEGSTNQDPYDYLVLAYPAYGGKAKWVTRYSGGAGDILNDLVLSQELRRLFVTGGSQAVGTQRTPMATVALDSVTGEQVWEARHDDNPGNADYSLNYGNQIVLSPDHDQVYVAGENYTFENATHGVTIAYDTGDGEMNWKARYDGIDAHWSNPTTDLGVYSNQLGDQGYALGVAPEGDRVYVAFCSMLDPGTPGAFGGGDSVTLAYSSSTGEPIWSARYAGSRYTGPDHPSSYVAPSCPHGLAVHPTTGRVFVAGAVSDANDDVAAVMARGTVSVVDSDYSLLSYER